MQTTGKKVITRVLGLTYAPCMDTYTTSVEVRFTSDIDESWSMMTKHEYGFLLSSLFFSSLFFSSFSLITNRDKKEYKPSQHLLPYPTIVVSII